MGRQALNVFRMRLLGAEVVPAVSGSRTLKDAVNEAMRDWVATVENTHYCLGSVMGPHPYPWMVREFHRVIGTEARAQCAALLDGGVPDVVTACVGRWIERDRHLLGLRRHRRPSSSASSRPAARRSVAGVPGRGARHAQLPDAGRVRAGAGGRSRSRPASTTPASGPSTATSPPSAGPATSRSPTPRSSTRSSCCQPHRGHHPGARAGPRPGLGESRPCGARRAHGAAQPLGPGRQGRGPDDGHPRMTDDVSGRPTLDGAGRAGRRRDRSRRRCGRLAIAAASCSSPTSPAGSATTGPRSCGRSPTAGADAIEIGIPFSDPVMDGPVIQEASEQALAGGGHPGQHPRRAARRRRRRAAGGHDLLQPRLPHGPRALRRASLAEAGVSAAILPDLPLEEVGPWARAADAAGVETVLLAAPTAPDERLPRVVRPGPRASSTPSACSASPASATRWPPRSLVIARRLKAVTDKPVLVGVGVSNAAAGGRGQRRSPTASSSGRR